MLGACALVACAADEDTKPTPPDLDALVAAYAMPTRAFDEAAAIEVEAIVESKVKALLHLDDLASELESVLNALAEDEAMQFAPQRHAIVLEGEGFARIERICRGHGDPAPAIDKAANGHLDLTVNYSEKGLDAVIFGGAVRCLEQVASTRLAINGAIRFHIGENLKLAQVSGSPVLFQLADFALDVDGTRIVDGGFDFQVCRGTTSNCVPGNIEVLLGLSSGTSLVFYVDLVKKTGGFRGANGIWTCDFAASRCTDANGSVVMTPVFDL